MIILAGPNGAGKSTAATALLPGDLPFVNADEVAKTLPGYPSRAIDVQAARLVLERLDELGRLGESFSVETTLSGRSLAARCARLRGSGYRVRLLFLWSPGAEFCIQRVAARVRAGGHTIPEDVIRRRYDLGLRNFFAVYQVVADRWAVFDATGLGTPRPIAEGTMTRVDRVDDPVIWRTMQERAGHGT